MNNSSNSTFPRHDSKDVANGLNNHFANVATHNLNDSVNIRPCGYDGQYFQGQFKLTLVSQSNVIKEVKRMKNKKICRVR